RGPDAIHKTQGRGDAPARLPRKSTMRTLIPADEERLQNLLVEAFPTRADLEELVRFSLGVTLDQVGFADNLVDAVFKLITFATPRGELEQVVTKALELRPRSAALAAWATSVGVEAPRGTATRWTFVQGPRRWIVLAVAGAVLLVV